MKTAISSTTFYKREKQYSFDKNPPLKLTKNQIKPEISSQLSELKIKDYVIE